MEMAASAMGLCRLVLDVWKHLCGPNMGPLVSSFPLVHGHSLRMRNTMPLAMVGNHDRVFLGLP